MIADEANNEKIDEKVQRNSAPPAGLQVVVDWFGGSGSTRWPHVRLDEMRPLIGFSKETLCVITNLYGCHVAGGFEADFELYRMS